MIFKHTGLYFTDKHIEQARANRERPPVREAWKMLRERQQSGVQEAQWDGFRYRFDNDVKRGENGVKCLLADNALDESMTYVDALKTTLIQAQSFEMLRDHPAMDSEKQAQFLNQFWERLVYLNEVEYERSYVEMLMLGLLDVVGGIVLEQEAIFERGAEIYRRVIREDVHPQGYITKAVQVGDGGGLLRQLIAVQTLVLMAEAAAHVGVDLWSYSFRGVSVMTAFTYIMYYYFLPEKWRWDENVTNEPFREYNGMFEIVNHHAYPKDLKPLLEDMRPIYDAPFGGLTTLSHGVVRKRGLFGK